MRNVQDEQFAYAVLIDGERFAIDRHGVKWITGKKKDAQAFAKELAEHLSGKCRPVRVRVKIELAPTV
jgi:hypothetical protein